MLTENHSDSIAFITCKHCGKHRKSGPDYKTSGLCIQCYQKNRPYHDCPQCGTAVAGAGNSICASCDRENKIQARIELNLEMIEDLEFRERFLKASKNILSKSSTSKLIRKVDKLAYAIRFLEKHSKDAENVDQKQIMASIENEISRSYSTLASLLSDAFSIEWDADFENDVLESRRIEDIVSRNDGEAKIVLQGYLDYLQNNEKREYKKKTIRVYMRCAEAFLDVLCKDISISECSPKSVKYFQLRNPGLRSSLRVFFNFIEAVYGIRYSSLPIRKTDDNKLDRILREECINLINRISQSTDLSERKALTARVISLLYGIPLKAVVNQTADNFVVSKGDVYWEVDDNFIAMPEIVSKYIVESIESKKSRFIFWGDGGKRPMSTASINYWISV